MAPLLKVRSICPEYSEARPQANEWPYRRWRNCDRFGPGTTTFGRLVSPRISTIYRTSAEGASDSASTETSRNRGHVVTKKKRTTKAPHVTVDIGHAEALLKTGALQKAIFNSANFSSIATDAKGVIQIFNVGAERMLGYSAADVVNKVTPADLSDPQELVARAAALSLEFATPIKPGFEALVFKAARGIEDIYELTKLRKDGSRFPAVVSVTALRDAQDAIIGYLLIGTDNTARKLVEEERVKFAQTLQKNVELEAASRMK